MKMFQYELQKSRRQWGLVAVVTLLLAAYYIFTAFGGSFNTFTGGALENYQDKAYVEWKRSEKTGVVDDEWIESINRKYRALVDANCLTLEQSREQLDSVFQGNAEFTAEEALENRYDINYALGVLPYHDFFGDSYIGEQYHRYFNTIIPMAQDPVGYVKWDYARNDVWAMREDGMSYLQRQGYSDAQIDDFWKLVERRYDDLKIVVGYSMGWDVLTSVMRYLPFTLGIAILVVLGNLFAQERNYAMTPILRTTRFGRKKLLRTKLSLALMISAGMWVLFQGLMLLAIAIHYSLDGATVTVLSYMLHLSIYGLNWIQYYLIQCAFSFLGTMVFALFVCCLSSLLPLKIMLPVGLITTLITGIPLDKFTYLNQAFSLIDKVKMLTPAQLMAAYPTLQVYQSYSVGGFQIQLPYAMAIAIVIETILFLLFLNRREGGK